MKPRARQPHPTLNGRGRLKPANGIATSGICVFRRPYFSYVLPQPA
ncbi:hypothetical protein [Kingella potus]|nr:hypothetical protein [Kingella potus]UOP01281.1 hypothetical protein LVJ84_03195 [Kingella potus]